MHQDKVALFLRFYLEENCGKKIISSSFHFNITTFGPCHKCSECRGYNVTKCEEVPAGEEHLKTLPWKHFSTEYVFSPLSASPVPTLARPAVGVRFLQVGVSLTPLLFPTQCLLCAPHTQLPFTNESWPQQQKKKIQHPLLSFHKSKHTFEHGTACRHKSVQGPIR